MKTRRLVWLIPFLALLASPGAFGYTMILKANQVLENNGNFWVNPQYTFEDDTLNATVLGTANGARYLRVGLDDPSADTINKKITGVSIYAIGRSSYSKSKARLQPYFDDADTAGTQSGILNFGISEVVRSFDITLQRDWSWQALSDLSVKFIPRTAANFYIDHIFAVVNYTDSAASEAHSFEITPIASPQVMGRYFPLVISARDGSGSLQASYNETATLSDSTGTINPYVAQFTAGLCSLGVMIGEASANTAITVNDGDTFAVSNGFAVISALHHFAFSSIASPQNIGQPFAVTVTASDFSGDTVASFTGRVDLWDRSGTLTPDSSGSFAVGVWTGSLTVGTVVDPDTVFCSYTDLDGTFYGSSNGFAVINPSGVAGERPSPEVKAYSMEIWPNPAEGRTRITLALPRPGRVALVLYNILGQEVARQESGLLPAGTSRIDWAFGPTQPQGLYFLRAMVDGKQMALKKLLIAR